MIPVVSVQCRDYSEGRLSRAVEEALSPLGGLESFVRPGQRVLLKPNLLRPSSPRNAVTTHPSLIRALAQMVRDIGAEPIIGDSPSLGPWPLLTRITGMADVAKATGARLVNLDTPRAVRTPEGFSFRVLEIAQEVFEVDVVINLPKLKTHTMTTLTLGVKNLFGCVPGMRKSAWHLKAGTDRTFFGELLLEIALLVKPALTILDAVWGMEGNGPTSGNPRFVGRILASPSPIALDRVVAEAIGLQPEEVPYLAPAVKRGLLPEARLLGEPLRLEGFKLPDTMPPLPRPFRGIIRRLLTPRPKVDKDECVGCGECEEVCPPKAISLRDGFPQINYDACIRCYCCQEICQRGAIRLR